MRILVVEDEQDMNHLIADKLRGEDYTVDSCFDGDTAYDYIKMYDYDGIILDIMLPGMDGRTLLKVIRQEKIITPVMFLSARDTNEDIVEGLDLGADDYLVKPFDFDVLLARLRAMLRKSIDVHENVYRCGDLELYPSTREVIRNGVSINLSPKEFSILYYMIRNQNIVLTREQIETNVWDIDEGTASNVVDVYIRYLRKKIDDAFSEKLIHTIRGVGYRLSYDKKE